MKKQHMMHSKIMGLVAVMGLLMAETACQPMSSSTSRVGFTPLSVSAPDCDYGGRIRSVEALDADTVRFTLCEPDPAFAEELANPIFSIQDSDFLNEHGGSSSAMNEALNSTGPYELLEYIPGDHISLISNPEYWGPPPRSNLIYFTWASDAFQRYSTLRFDLADVVDSPAPEDYTLILNDDNLQLHFRPNTNTFYIGFNHSIAPFDDPQFRLGVATGVMRDALLSEEFPQGSTLAEQFIPPSFSPGYTEGLEWYGSDLTAAHEILAGTNYDFSQHVQLYYPDFIDPYLPSPANTAFLISRQMSLAGLRVDIVPMDPDEFNQALEAGELGFFLNYLLASYPDSANFYNRFTSNSLEFGEPLPELVEAIRQAHATTSSDIRQEYYDTANQLIKDNVILIPVAHLSYAIANRITYENVIAGAFSENITEMGGISDRLGFMQSVEPFSFWPTDETDPDTFRIARLLFDTLTAYSTTQVGITPSLAVSWEHNTELTEWTFSLRYQVMFTNGAELDANDVVASFSALWNAADPNHIGRTGEFRIFREIFGNFLNAPVEN